MTDRVGLCASTFNTKDINWNMSRPDGGLTNGTVRQAVESAWRGDRQRLEDIHYTLGCFRSTGVPNADAAQNAFLVSAKRADNELRAQGGVRP